VPLDDTGTDASNSYSSGFSPSLTRAYKRIIIENCNLGLKLMFEICNLRLNPKLAKKIAIVYRSTK